jgi:hypothetical protein
MTTRLSILYNHIKGGESMVNLAIVVMETILRGGLSLAKDLQVNYTKSASVPGISVMFHPGYDIDALAHAGHFRHNAISYTSVAQLQQALGTIGYEIVLRATPSPNNPDHHSLLVSKHGQIQPTLLDDVAQALAQEFGKNIVPNPYKQP